MTRYVILHAFLATMCLLLLTSCGGGSQSNSSTTSALTSAAGRGSVQFTILWPAGRGTSRVIPAGTQSIEINITSGTTLLASKIVGLPPAGQTTTNVGFVGLQPGTVTVTASAYTSPPPFFDDGGGSGGGGCGGCSGNFSAIATGSTSVQIVAGTITQGTLTMNLVPASVHGTLLDMRQIPVAGAVVTLAGTSLSATTQANGEFTIINAPLGPAALSVSNLPIAKYYPYCQYEGNEYDLNACTISLLGGIQGGVYQVANLNIYDSVGVFGNSLPPPPPPPPGCPS